MFALLTGLLAGFIHVWTGPDHLTAVAPPAVRRPERAWIPGVRWGFGHSAGVAVVGLLSLLLRDLIPVEWLCSWGERLVGVMLFGIGLWALHQAFKNKIHAHQHEHDGEQHVHFHAHHHDHAPEKAAPHRHTHAAFGIGTTLAVVLAMLALFHKEFLLVSFDRAMAATLGKNVLLWGILIYLLIGVTVSISVLSVGPLISFGFLLVPALTAHLFARNMKQFFTLASVIGGVAAFLGFWLAYQWDWPVGPTDVVLLGIIFAMVWAGHGLLKFFKKNPA